MRKFAALVAVAVIFLPTIADAESRPHRNAPEEVAVETALSKGYVSRDEQSISHEGLYQGMRGPCDLVTVRVTYSPDDSTVGRTEQFDYQVCNGRISETGAAGPIRTDFGIPDGIESFAQGIAAKTQVNGRADGDYQGFKVLGRTVRSEDKCSIEVRIMWEGRLYNRIDSACAPPEDGIIPEPLHYISGSGPDYRTWL